MYYLTEKKGLTKTQAALIVLLAGTLKECTDKNFDWGDMGANCAGISLVIVF